MLTTDVPDRRILRLPPAELPMRFKTMALTFLLPVATTMARGTAADYKRSEELNRKYQGLAGDVPEAPHWISASRFWYRKAVTGGNAFVRSEERRVGKEC